MTAPASSDSDGTRPVKDEPWQSGSAHLVRQVAELAAGLQFWTDGRLDVDSQAGRDAAASVLRGLHVTLHAVGATAARRTYRTSLPERVHATWTDQAYLYSIQVLTAGVHGAVFFNSRQHWLSGDARALFSQLSTRLEDTRRLLDRLLGTPAPRWAASDEAELRLSLEEFDEAWACFEEQFFSSELCIIEAEAKGLLLEAVELVNQMNQIAIRLGESANPRDMMRDPEFFLHHNHFVGCVSRLNLEVNPDGRGRTFEPSVLEESEAVVWPLLGEDGILAAASESPAFTVAFDAVFAWDDLCCYVHRVAQHVDVLDPELRHNEHLVKFLNAWDSSWEFASAYVVDKTRRRALDSLVGQLREVQKSVPQLAGMLDEHSPDLFVVLPRLVWLSFLGDALGIQPLLEPLLPHHFAVLGDAEAAPNRPGSELLAFMEDYKQIWNLLARVVASAQPERRDVQALVWAVLSSGAVVGVGDGSVFVPVAALDFPAGHKAEAATRSFLLRLESWSMELQRHNANDWNRFSALLSRCLNPLFPVALSKAI